MVTSLLLATSLFLQPVTLDVPNPPPVVDQEVMRANGLAMRGDARSLVGKISTAAGLLFGLAGAALLADPTNCKFNDDDRKFLSGWSDKDRCRAVGGVAVGVGTIGLGIGAWLWASGSGMKDEADAIRAGRRGPALGVSVEPNGARAGLTWRF